MTSLNEKERSLRAYLLGGASPDEQRQIEERLLLNGDEVELLLILEEELIDSYICDTLSNGEREQFQTYFLSTPQRWRKLRMAKALRRFVNNEQPIPAPAKVSKLRSILFGGQPLLIPAWRLAIATILIVGVLLGIWRIFLYQSLVDKGRATLQSALRESPTEARIAGFQWPPQSITLGEQPKGVADTSLMDQAFSYLRDAVNQQPGPDSYYALGQFYLAKGELPSAIEQFNRALESMPKNARLHSDIGAALLEMARRETTRLAQDKGSDRSKEYLFQSLEHLKQALELDASLLEALFNRAICYQYLQLLPQAETDWHAYLGRDANSPWAEEARRHLKEIEDQKQRSSKSKQEQFQEFLNAYHIGDSKTAWKVISQTRELINGRLIWWQLLDDFFDLSAAGQFAEATARMEALRYAGKLELHLGEEKGQSKGDPYIAELAAFYSATSPQQRTGLLEAHKQINEGNKLYLSNQYDAALDNYTKARQSLARFHNQGEILLTDLLMSYSYIQKGETEKSIALLEKLVEESRKRGYRWLLAQSLFSLGMVQDRLAEHSKALEHTSQALQISVEIDDAYNIQRSLAQIADQYRKLGNYQLSTTYLSRCLNQISAAWPGNRQMWRNCDQFTQVLSAKRLNAAAAAYASEALRLAIETNDPSYVYISYIHLALIYAKQQNYGEAIRLAQIGLDTAPNDVSKAYASLQLGHMHSQAGDLHQALKDYDESIKYIDLTEAVMRARANSGGILAKTNRLPALRYDAGKGRLFCLFAQGNDIHAREELARTLELLEKHRESIREEQNRNTFFNAEQSVYDAAINFEASRGNNQAVFDYSEESRARSLLELVTTTQAITPEENGQPQNVSQPISHPLSLNEVQQRLPEQTQLIEYVVLDDKLLICLVSKSEFSIKEVQIRRSELTDRVLNFRRSILRHTTDVSGDARELYNLLIKQIELSPEKGRQICIVPDKVLNNLPFAALISPDSGSYLVEDYQLTVAPSATIYLVCSEWTKHKTDWPQERLLAVGNPSFDSTAFPSLPALPSTRQQVQKIGAFYPLPSVLTETNAIEEVVKRQMEQSDVIHLASHYVVYEGNPMNSRLLLAQESVDHREADNSRGVLQANEVYGLKLRKAPLVILSACESGVEDYYSGEGMIGMSRVFIAAGAPVVVASLWQVDAYATDELMINFHRHRRLEMLSASEALRLAQVDMLSNPSKKHPYYWAGFTTIGGHMNSGNGNLASRLN
jgi:CHAT domain-containing protein